MKTKFNVIDWLRFLHINWRDDGKEVRIECFACGKEEHLYINTDDNTFICFKCGVSGGEQALREGILKAVVTQTATKVGLDYFISRGLQLNIVASATLGYYDRLNRYTIPYYNEKNEVTNISFRALNGFGDNDEKKYLRMPGVASTPYFLGNRTANMVIITEGEIDALTIHQAFPEALVCGLPGASFVNDSLIASLPAAGQIIGILDNDNAGATAIRKLRTRIPSIRIGSVESKYKDVNDLLVAEGPDAVRRLIQTVLESKSGSGPISESNENSESRVDSKSFGPITSRNYLLLPDEHKTWLIDGLWLDRSLGFVAGEPKAMKSMFTLHLAYHVAAGKTFVNKQVLHPGPVLLVQEEDMDLTIKTRLRRINAVGTDNLYIWTPGSVGEHVRLDSDDSMEKLDDAIREIQPVLVILDPLANMHQLENENDAASINRMLERLRYVRDLRKCSIMVVHHLRKENMHDRGMSGQRMRGSSVLHAKSESALYLEKWGDLLRISIETKMQQGRVLEVRYNELTGFTFEDEHGAGVGEND